MQRTVISSKSQAPLEYLREILGYKLLMLNFARRDIKIKYSQTFLGLLLTMVQPLALLIIFTLLFEQLIQLDTGAVPYPLFAFSGILAWNLFSNVLVQSGGSLTASRDIIHNIYFPRMILPLSKGLGGLAESLIQTAFLAVLMIYFGQMPGWQLLGLPLYMVLNLMAGLGIGIWLAALSLRYRDLMHAVPFVVGMGIWLTPVYYPVSLIPAQYKWMLGLNPVTGILEGYRWAIWGGQLDFFNQVCSLSMILLLFFTGWWRFRKSERAISDFI